MMGKKYTIDEICENLNKVPGQKAWIDEFGQLFVGPNMTGMGAGSTIEPVECYQFECSPDEYDPQRIVRECVENGRLWFMVDRVRNNKQFHHTNLLFIRKDFLRDHVGAVDAQILDSEWGMGFTPCNSSVQCPVGYRCIAFHDNERDNLLEQLKAATKTKRTYTVYYHGGK